MSGNRLVVRGYLYARDFPEVARRYGRRRPQALGMSYELADARVEDMRAEIWKLTRRNLYRRGDPAAGEGGIPSDKFSHGELGGQD